MNILEIKHIYDNWESLVDDLKSEQNKSKFIYRGQSNGFDSCTKKFNVWNLVSSFNRFYSNRTYLFRTFLSQQFSPDLFKIVYKDYKFEKIKELINSTLLEKIYFFQHYGIPTCFLDFTYNPIFALYFAISDVKGTNVGAFDSFGNPIFYPEDYFISIYKFDYNFILENLNVKKISAEDFYLNYDKYYNGYCHIGLDLNPIENCKNKNLDNYNLDKQEGCFILYDNSSNNNCLLKYLEYLVFLNDIKINKPFVTRYDLKYNSVFPKMHSRQPTTKNLFSFLREENAIGKNLFNDIQGLRLDLNFFHA